MTPEIQALIDKAEAAEAKAEQCEQSGGHDFNVAGFSLIAHPDMALGFLPKTEEVEFSSYVCSQCGERLSREEGIEYMRAKYYRSPERQQEQLRDRLLMLYPEGTARELYPHLFI